MYVSGVHWLLLAVACGTVLLVLMVVGVGLLIKFGVIVGEATRPQHHDTRDYTINQGREVRPEDGSHR